MNLKINYLENKIEFSNEFINAIEIENKKYFYRLINDIYSIEKNGYSDEITLLSNDNTEININGKIKIFVNFLDFGFDSKKISSSLTKYISNELDEEDKSLLQNQYNKLIKVYKKILNEIDIPLGVEEDVDIESLSKILKLSINYKNELLDNLFILIDIEKLLKENNILVFINLKQYLSKDEITELYKYSIYNQIQIILIDSQNYGTTLEYEKKLIIDDNLEEIML